jgi:hypothetical protein
MKGKCNANFPILIVMLGSSSLIVLSGLESIDAQQPANVNISKVIEQKFTRTITIPETGSVFKDLILAEVNYESQNTVLISGDLIAETKRGTTIGFNKGIWEAMDLLKNQYGFKLQNVMTSGVGSVGNPTTVYILMTK